MHFHAVLLYATVALYVAHSKPMYTEKMNLEALWGPSLEWLLNIAWRVIPLFFIICVASFNVPFGNAFPGG